MAAKIGAIQLELQLATPTLSTRSRCNRDCRAYRRSIRRRGQPNGRGRRVRRRVADLTATCRNRRGVPAASVATRSQM